MILRYIAHSCDKLYVAHHTLEVLSGSPVEGHFPPSTCWQPLFSRYIRPHFCPKHTPSIVHCINYYLDIKIYFDQNFVNTGSRKSGEQGRTIYNALLRISGKAYQNVPVIRVRCLMEMQRKRWNSLTLQLNAHASTALASIPVVPGLAFLVLFAVVPDRQILICLHN